MANSIATSSMYVDILDDKYKKESVTSVLDAPDEYCRETADPKTVLLPSMVLDPLVDYSRSGGFSTGDVTLTYSPYTFSMDRGRMFTVDAFDNIETAMVAFGRLAGEFIKEHVAPEVDAYRLSKYAEGAALANKVSGSVTAENALSAIDTACMALDQAEVPEEGRVLFVSSAMYALLKQSSAIDRYFDVGEGGKVDRRITMVDDMPVVKVPAARFYSAYTFNDGVTSGQTAGGFVKAASGKAINFMIVHPSSVLQITKCAKTKIVTPDRNPTADAYKFGYRLYHDAFVIENKASGIYVHTANA